jgi:potassium/sodium efflux P-type ATPase
MANESSQPIALWHSKTIEEVFKSLDTNKNGLTEEEASKRSEKYGPNKLPEKGKKSELVRFIKQFDNILIYVLLAAAVVTSLLGHWIDTWIIFAVVFINALIGFIQEGKAEKALEGIKNMLSLKANVLRNGRKNEINAVELVPGDIVSLTAGDKIPADLRIFAAKNFKIEESPLTGESVAVIKNPEPVAEDAELGSRTSMAYSGTTATYGNAKGIVIGIGENTELGKINKMLSEAKEITTPLLKQIDSFGKKLAVTILSLAAILFLFGYFVQDYEINEIFMAVISLAVAAIPEGLPAIMTITLAIGVQRMANRNAIIRKLPSVETLGAVSVICSDKTGTLTRNEMTAKLIVIDGQNYDIEGEGYNPEGNIRCENEKVEISKLDPLKKLLQTAWICNEAEIRKDDGKWKLVGEPTEGALKTLGFKGGLQDFQPERLDDIPFDSEHKYMATLNKGDDGKIIYIKGAPEKLLDMCNKQLTADGEKELEKEFWLEKINEVAANGMRMLGTAYKIPTGKSNELEKANVEDSAVFLGLVGIIDPPRKEAIGAVKHCKEAGIKVKMITGDHKITAKTIARKMNIGHGENVVDGKSMDRMEDGELQIAVMENDVFARTSPEHKVRLIKALRANNLISAMTGDGVNDAPALKTADVGIAMGIKGTEVAKDTAEMVLADDNFASITNAVEEGRTVYDNLRKALIFILPTNGSESLVIIAAVILGITMPISPAQILWVNMVTAVTLALALSFEPMEKDVMKNPPRDPEKSIIGGYFLFRIIYLSLLLGGSVVAIFLWLINQHELIVSRTVAVNSLVAGQLFYLLNCRKLRHHTFEKDFFNNKAVLIACVTLVLLQLVFTYTPFMNEIFASSPITGILMLYPLMVGLGIFFIVELEKWVMKRWNLLA